MQLILPEELPALLSRKSRKTGGARSLRRLVQDQVEGPLAECLLESEKKSPKIKACLENGQLLFKC